MADKEVHTTIRARRKIRPDLKRRIFSVVLSAALILCIHTTGLAAAAVESEPEGGILEQEIDAQQDLFCIRLLGVAEYEVTDHREK